MPGDSIPILRLGGELQDAPQQADNPSLRLYQDVSPSVVRIETNRNAGSGFAVGKPGEIVTNFHVVVDAQEVFVRTQDGTRYRARIKNADDIKDLAVLEIDGKAPASLRPLTIGDDKSLGESQQISAFGHPRGKDSVYLSPGTLAERTTNIKRFSNEQIFAFSQVSGTAEDKQAFLKNDLLHGNIHLKHGNSGGPLVDNDGKVVGVSVYKSELNDSDAYFVPSTELKSFLSQKDQPKFNFDYKYELSGLAKDYMQHAQDKPILTSTATLAAGYAGLRGLASPHWLANGASAGIAAYGGLSLVEDVSLLAGATNRRDLLKAGLSTLGDSALLAGGLTRAWMGTGVSSALLSGAESRLATTIGAGVLGAAQKTAITGAGSYLTTAGKVGLALIALGAAAKIASNFIPDRLVNTGVTRTNGETRLPFYLGR